MKKHYIIAGNYDQYKRWILERGLDKTEFVFVAAPDALRGIENPHGIFIGTWYEREDMQEILLRLLTASRVENPELRKAIKYYEDKLNERKN